MVTEEKPESEMIPLPVSEKDGMVKVLGQVDHLSRQNKFLFILMTAVVIVLFASFLGFAIDAFIYRTEAYKEHKTILKEERSFINEEIEIRNNKIKEIESRIEFLEEKNVSKEIEQTGN